MSTIYRWPETLRQLSFKGWAAIIALQVCLHYVLPYTLVRGLFRIMGVPFPWMLAFTVEMAFFIYMEAVPLRKVRQSPLVVEPPTKSPDEIWSASLEKVKIANSLGYPFEKFISGWFLGADPKKVRRDNLVEWCSHMLYVKDPQDLDPKEREMLLEKVDQTVEVCGLSPEPGYDPDVQCVRFLLEPVRVLRRSLLIYVLASWLPRLGTMLFFKFVLGLKREQCKKSGLKYWWRAPAGEEGSQPHDLLFFHGLCGFTGYVPMLACILLSSPSRGAVLLELEDVSQCLNLERWPSRQAVISAVQSGVSRMAEARGGSKRPVTIVGHSLGTCAATTVLEECHEADLGLKVGGLVMIDPVSMLLELPDVCHGFLYKSPREFFDWLCLLWCSGEPGISLYFRRRFFWYNNTFTFKLLEGKPALVCLSEHDQMVPSHAVRAFLDQGSDSKGLDVIWWPNTGHTGFMMNPWSQMQIVRWVQACK